MHFTFWISAYIVVDVSSETCDAITTKADCEEAYKQLGLFVGAIDDNQSGSADDPPFCYMKWGRLKFNTDGSNTGLCDENGRECLCIEGNGHFRTLEFKLLCQVKHF